MYLSKCCNSELSWKHAELILLIEGGEFSAGKQYCLKCQKECDYYEPLADRRLNVVSIREDRGKGNYYNDC